VRYGRVAAAILACSAAGALSSIAIARSGGQAASAAYYYYCPDGGSGGVYGYCPPTTTTTTTTTVPTEGKVTICHRTRSATNPYVRITVSVNALDAHERHGDIIPAPPVCPGD
jgi:hypothetical protein